MTYKPLDDYFALFATSQFDTGSATDADIAPYGYAFQDGVYDTDFPLTITNLETGLYKASGTVPADYTSGDSIDIQILATVNSVEGKGIIDHFVVDSKRNSDLNDITVADNVSGILAGVVDGSIDVETALKRILATTSNDTVISGTDPRVLADRKSVV